MDRARVLAALPEGRLDRAVVADAIGAWVRSEPMRTLAAASGWEWPDRAPLPELLAELIGRSDDWDFRGQQARKTAVDVVERGEMPFDAAVVGGRVVPEDLVLEAAAELGLVHSEPPTPTEPFTHLVILSGGVRGCLNRARYAADLLVSGLRTDLVVSLTAHRLLGATRPMPDARTEREQATDLGLGQPDSESGVALAALQQAFRLGPPQSVEESAPDEGTEEQRLGRSATYRWPGFESRTIPSPNPAGGARANTGDQLVHWRDHAPIGPEHRVLLVTTQIYVPYQHLVAIELLGLESGCGVWTCGVDATTAAVPTRQFTAADYLQEVRSALGAAARVVAAS